MYLSAKHWKALLVVDGRLSIVTTLAPLVIIFAKGTKLEPFSAVGTDEEASTNPIEETKLDCTLPTPETGMSDGAKELMHNAEALFERKPKRATFETKATIERLKNDTPQWRGIHQKLSPDLVQAKTKEWIEAFKAKLPLIQQLENKASLV